jgi:hypothetical protein
VVRTIIHNNHYPKYPPLVTAEEEAEADLELLVPDPVDDQMAFLTDLFQSLDLDTGYMEAQFLWDAAVDYIERYPAKAREFAAELLEERIDEKANITN